MLESMLEGMAEYYSAELSEKVTRGLTENALKCKYNGGTLPIGYMIDSGQYFQIDPLKFMPSFSSITIKRENAGDEGNGSQVFVYKITAVTDPELTVYITLTTDEKGSGSVTVKDLPCRDYTVEQVESWSWRYKKDSSQTVSVKKDIDNTVTFSEAATEQHRLNGNSAPVQNRRQGATVS